MNPVEAYFFFIGEASWGGFIAKDGKIFAVKLYADHNGRPTTS